MSPLPEQHVGLCAASPVARTQEPTVADVGAALVRDLRSPLTTIERYLDLLADGEVGGLTVEQLEYLDVARRNVQRVSTLVNDWLDVTRLEAGKLSLVCGAVNVNHVVERVLVGLRPSIEAKHHHVTVQLPAHPILAHADERALLRVVGNLLSNAHKYTPPGGSIRVTIATEPDDRVRLDIADTGIGVTEEDRQLLFSKFFRARLTESEPGTGLGLALTRALVERMDGRVCATSALGQGSTFSVSLLQASASAAPSPVATATA
jgi:signal transduction histidine kinase